jgi:hypothetical protein
MTTFKRVCFIAFTLLALCTGAQEAPIQKEYVSPETENIDAKDEAKRTNYAIGGGAIAIILIIIATRAKRKRRQKLRDNK